MLKLGGLVIGQDPVLIVSLAAEEVFLFYRALLDQHLLRYRGYFLLLVGGRFVWHLVRCLH